MSVLTINLPDNQVQSLQRIAREGGVSVDALVTELVETMTTHAHANAPGDVTDNSLFNIRAYDSEAPANLSQSVDLYLY